MELLRFKKDQAYLTLDFETCNLSLLPQSNSPWQLGWQYNSSKENFAREDWIKWDDLDTKMSKDAAAITRFSFSEYNYRAKEPGPILDLFDRYFLDPEVISISANGAKFDAWMYNIYRQLLGRDLDWSWYSRHVDIQILEKAAILGCPIPKIGTDEWTFFNIRLGNFHQRGLKTNLAHLCGKYDVPYDASRHHVESLFDVELTKSVFDKQIRTLDIFI